MRRVKQFTLAGIWIPLLLLVALVATGPAGSGLDPSARAEVLGEIPTFSNPLNITNPYFPFQPGGIKVFAGKENGVDLTVVVRHLPHTRTFQWRGTDVTCVIRRETEFIDGDVVAVTEEHYAQADSGAVYFFGEVADQYLDGVIAGHEDSWLVGGPEPGDPAETAAAEDPALFLLVDQQVGDEWTSESLSGTTARETRKVLRFTKKVRVPAGKFRDCVEIEEIGADGERERKWYAPGTGIVKVKGSDEKLKLVATTIRPR